MKFSYRYIGLVLLFVPALCMAQGSKTLKKNNVISQTTLEYFLAEGQKDPVVEKVETYDEEGNVTEIKVFNRSGEVKQWEKFSYDEDGEVTEEQYLDEKGQITERIEYTYENKLVQEKRYFDHKDRLVKKKTYGYKYREAAE